MLAPTLSPYSSSSLEILLDLLPDLQDVVALKEGYFELQTTTPAGWEFWISSAEDELTVGFAEYHTHFGWQEGDALEDALAAAAFVRKLQAGQLVLAVWYEGTDYVSSQPVKSTENAQPKTWLQRWWRRKQTLVIKQWSE
jgi:hypothetical protein